MINLELTKAEALLAYELFKQNNDELLEQIMQNVDEEMTSEHMQHEARKNYRINIENEAKKVAGLEAEIQALKAQLDAKNLASNPAGFKNRNKPLKPDAPWGYKKDGTPKQRPGRPVKG